MLNMSKRAGEGRRRGRRRMHSIAQVRWTLVFLGVVCGGSGGGLIWVMGVGGLPHAEVVLPEPDEGMLLPSGALLILFKVFEWESGRMRVRVNNTGMSP